MGEIKNRRYPKEYEEPSQSEEYGLVEDLDDNDNKHHSHHHRHRHRHRHHHKRSFKRKIRHYLKNLKHHKTQIQILCIVVISLIIIGLLLYLFVIKKNISTENALSLYSPQLNNTDYDVCPIDFESLKSENSDIYGWIEIPNTNVSYPLVHKLGENTFYLNHNFLGEYDVKGSIFSEDYNKDDLSDPVTVLYGHHMYNGDMFGNLEKYYSQQEFFDENRTLNIYLPDQKKVYKIFAAIPFSGIHLLCNNDFTNSAVFNDFFEHVYMTRGINANVDSKMTISSRDKVVILSTCLTGNNSDRYLLCAVEIKEQNIKY